MRTWGILVCVVVSVWSQLQSSTEVGEPVSFLALTTAGPHQCTSLGDTHVSTNFFDGGNYNVMGENEWIVAKSLPEPGQTTPYFEVQSTQTAWNTHSSCAPLYPHITIAKDVAVKCGNVLMLYKTTRGISNADNCPDDPIYAPNTDFEQIFVNGTIEGRGNFDFQQFAVGSNLNQRFYFAGKRASFQVTRLPCEAGCKKRSNAPTSALKIFCDEAEIAINAYRSGGGSHTQITLTIPDANQVNSLIRNGNMIGGYCGGWPLGAAVPEYAKVASRNLNQCRNVATVAQPYALKGKGQGQPGEVGDTPVNGHKNAVALFYTTDPCRDFFLTSDTTSIFRLFELKTQGKSVSYDALRWSSQGKTVLALDTAATDLAKKAAANAACEAIRKQFDNRPLSALNKTAAKDSALLDVTKSCAEDYYFDLVWDVPKFSAALCTMYQGFIDRERQDIKCANVAIRTLKMPDAQISVLGFNTDSNSASQIYLTNLKALKAEVKTSQENIVFWDNGECPLAPLDLKANPVDCSKHTFTNTLIA